MPYGNQMPVTYGGNQYPTAYPNPYQQSYTVSPYQYSGAQSSQNQNGMNFTWVQGEEGAKAYPVGAGNKVLLMDSENPVLYMKAADLTGRPTMEIYDLVPRVRQVNASQPEVQNFLTKDEFYNAIEDLRKEIRNNGQSAI